MVLGRRRRRLRCTFCGKRDEQVSRLIAGARGYICDACVGVCNKILEATPSSFSGWQVMSDKELLDHLGSCLATVEATRQVLQMQIDTLRGRGVSWDLIGKSLGVSRQAAWERFS
ncbi:MAG TPA: ClpX C4-type zinc finger protein [Steroidobacteraceae bacterium]|nr:ClpX C4-type zinc finger protein [Steroidobacteraceae bacterium]